MLKVHSCHTIGIFTLTLLAVMRTNDQLNRDNKSQNISFNKRGNLSNYFKKCANFI